VLSPTALNQLAELDRPSLVALHRVCPDDQIAPSDDDLPVGAGFALGNERLVFELGHGNRREVLIADPEDLDLTADRTTEDLAGQDVHDGDIGNLVIGVQPDGLKPPTGRLANADHDVSTLPIGEAGQVTNDLELRPLSPVPAEPLLEVQTDGLAGRCEDLRERLGVEHLAAQVHACGVVQFDRHGYTSALPKRACAERRSGGVSSTSPMALLSIGDAVPTPRIAHADVRIGSTRDRSVSGVAA